jgi:hypothetical protein
MAINFEHTRICKEEDCGLPQCVGNSGKARRTSASLGGHLAGSVNEFAFYSRPVTTVRISVPL